MIKRLIAAVLFFAVLDSCQKTTLPSSYTAYIIPRGSHYAQGNNLKMVTKSSMHFVAMFDSTCIYTALDPKNLGDIHKLYGFSDCNSQHHVNSARVGWVWNGKAIDLYAYCYADSVRSSKLLGSVAFNTPIELTIKADSAQYTFTMNGKNTTMKRSCGSAGVSGYQLYPYFGGDEVAPHDVHIFIKDL